MQPVKTQGLIATLSIFHFALHIFLWIYADSASPIHKRKKSFALRTDAGGQGLG
jgi:hypothetical protein